MNWILDSVFIITKYNIITIYHAISNLVISTDYDINDTNKDTYFPELRRVSEEYFEIKFQEVFVLKYLIFWIFQSPIGFIIYQTNHIMEILNEWFPTGNILKVYTPFWKDSTYEK